jgi:hypothetical protein
MTPLLVGSLIIAGIILFHVGMRLRDKSRETKKKQQLEYRAEGKLKRLAGREVTSMSTMTSWEDTLTHNGYTKDTASGDYISPDGDVLTQKKVLDIFNMASYSVQNASLYNQQAAMANSLQGAASLQNAQYNTGSYGGGGGGGSIAGSGYYITQSGIAVGNWPPTATFTSTSGIAIPSHQNAMLPSPTGSYTNVQYFDPVTYSWIIINIDVAYLGLINQLNAVNTQYSNTNPNRPIQTPLSPMQQGDFSLDEIGDAEVMIKELEHHADQ